jgi:hypothetical protein
MDEDAMGKVFCKNKSKLILITIPVLLILAVTDVHSSYREHELFKRGYDYYLSYQPEKAAEDFKTFLKEFPDSSARDAAMFWLGKSFVQLKSFEEARKIFSGIEHQFPDSPFMRYVKKEAEIMEARIYPMNSAAENNGTGEPVDLPPIIKVPETGADIDAMNGGNENDAPDAGTVPEGIRDMSAEKTELQADSRFTETSDAGFLHEAGRAYLVQIGAFKQQKKADALMSEFSKKGYKVKLNKITTPDGDELFCVIAGDFAVRKEAEAFVAELAVRENVNALIKISGRDAAELPAAEHFVVEEADIPILSSETAVEEMPHSADYSVSAMGKMGLRELVWKSGNADEDFINEQILLNEARKMDISLDDEKIQLLVEQFGLNGAEEEYLEKILLISELINLKLEEMPGETVVESLSVNFDEDKKEKTEFAMELQNLARNGVSFEEIGELYPKVVIYRDVGFAMLEEWIKERIQPLREGEVGVIWSEDGYMLLKPSSVKYSFNPFESGNQQRIDEVRASVALLINELRGKMELDGGN